MGEVKSVVSISVFIAAYALFVILPKYRTFAALGGAAALIATLTLTPLEALAAVNWNVMGIFVGMLFAADAFLESGVPAFLAEKIVARCGTVRWAVLFTCALVSFISIFVENVAAVLIVAPVALSIADKLKINPSKMLIAIAVCSNLQGTATLIGDPPSMLLAGYAKMNFLDFFVYGGKPGIFFAVELGAVASLAVLLFVFRRYRGPAGPVPVEKVRDWAPTIMLLGLIAALAISSFLDSGFSWSAGVLCMAAGAISFIWRLARREADVKAVLKILDWNTAGFLLGVFVLVGGISATGWIDRIADLVSGVVGGSVFLGFVLIVAFSVLFSAFVDNVPYLAAMLPVTGTLAARMGLPDPTVFLFGLLIGASLGGNITPIGASANIVAVGLLKKRGYAVRFREFAAVGLPFTLAATLAGAVYVWLVWGPR